METIQDTRNELFKRQELTFKLDSDTTPNFNDSKKQIAEQTKKPEENIDVHNIKSGLGNKTFTIHANIYDSKEDLDKIKQLQSTSKARKEAKKAEAEPAKEETKEETPSEESNEKPTEEAPAPEEQTEEPTEETKTPEEQPTKPEENKE